jgi:hypothetical protein
MVGGAWPCSYSGAVERACLSNGWLRLRFRRRVPIGRLGAMELLLLPVAATDPLAR